MSISRDTRHHGAVFIAIVAIVVVSIVVFPVGFRGADDYQYLIAAERWLEEGLNVGTTHWANRLPYVWGWAGAFLIFGKTEFALQIVHGVMLVTIGYLAWLIGQSELQNRRVALFGMVSVLFTPIIFRFSTYYYPER